MSARIALCGLLLFSGACLLGGVGDAELPEDPIAFSYRTPEEARRHAEDYQDDRERRRTAPGPTQASASRQGRNDFVANADHMNELLTRVFGTRSEKEEQHLGRLALLHPRTLEVEVVSAARRGAVPLTWSPDHERLLFAQPVLHGLQVFEFSQANRTVRRVTSGPMVHTQACYASEGRIVVAAVDGRQKPYRSHIAVSGPGGRAPFKVLTSGPSDHSPVCHPDTPGAAFVREEKPRGAQIFYLDDFVGAEPRRLSPGQHPSFSPDGAWLAFAAPYKRELRIWRIRPDGSGRAPIGRGVRHEARPTFSPDGRLVAYVAAEDRPRRHLYLRRLDGSGDRILFADGDGEYPVW